MPLSIKLKPRRMKKILTFILLFCLYTLHSKGQTLTNMQYKKMVLEYSNQIKSATQQYNSASYGTKAAKTGYLPNISGAGSYNYQFNPAPLALGGSSIDMKKSGYDAQVGIIQNIYSGGGVRSQVNIASTQEQIAKLAQSQTIEAVNYQAEVQYWTTSAYAEMLKVAHKYVTIVGELGVIIRNRFEMGAASKKDQLMVDTRLKEAELQFSYATKNFEVAAQNTNILMGIDPNQNLGTLDSIASLITVPIYGNIDSVLNNRADYNIAQSSIKLQEHITQAANSRYLPQLVAGVKETWGTSAINISGNTRFTTIAFAQLNVPIFHWFERSKVKSQNVAIGYALESQKTIVVDKAKSELNNAITSLKQSFEQIEISKTNLSYATQSLELNTYSYEQGRIGIIDVLSAQLSWIQAYTNIINAYLSNKIAIASYTKALGNLNQPDK